MESIREIARILSRQPEGSSRDGLDLAVAQALQALRIASGLEVAFLARFENGQRKFEVVDQACGVDLITPGTCGPLEDSWCHRVADGSLPHLMIDAGPYIHEGSAPDPGMPIGTHISVPVILQGGECFGTLCTFSSAVNPRTSAVDLRRVQGAAYLLGRRIDRARRACVTESAPG